MLKGVRVVFKNGVFIPTENVSIPNGTEGMVVYLVPKAELPNWWGSLNISAEKKGALKTFAERLKSKVNLVDLKVVEEEDNFEVFLIVYDESNSLKPALEEALKIYEETNVYIPLQVISQRRLLRWKETENPTFKRIERGTSLL